MTVLYFSDGCPRCFVMMESRQAQHLLRLGWASPTPPPTSAVWLSEKHSLQTLLWRRKEANASLWSMLAPTKAHVRSTLSLDAWGTGGRWGLQEVIALPDSPSCVTSCTSSASISKEAGILGCKPLTLGQNYEPKKQPFFFITYLVSSILLGAT